MQHKVSQNSPKRLARRRAAFKLQCIRYIYRRI